MAGTFTMKYFNPEVTFSIIGQKVWQRSPGVTHLNRFIIPDLGSTAAFYLLVGAVE